MKLAVTILASILAICSVTTAIPVNPSAATSAETSTSTAQPTEITSTESEYRKISHEEATGLVDISQFSENDANLIEEYLLMDQRYDDINKPYDVANFERLDQGKLVEQLTEQKEKLLHKPYQDENDPMYQEELENSKLKLKKALRELKRIVKKCERIGNSLYYATSQLNYSRENLAERLFQNGPSGTSLNSYVEFLESNRDFVEKIYESLTLQLSQQSKSE
ncbi:hypothetical protein BATDEDRAFT_28778 [Batrachochytrium dendrobatidis JAM81]|uniref:Uncharacterized protein n=1 Tax=Batrachochytrium dendrobatidis (strain JAM81 / FGSC 10211) TaxID=684364 RepID=F4PF40_BATDJ|nr:uncharacterized protein BATDEDRAFT_28778 [Batrachochytrium dendrobatidis JAM81]EGF76152.1 hypothetical protein BATDEDRAFT_28778 [Batrachochytrium dendrobatidis JAM81]|eukprot:XP_006683223.1 hypothetical protein BATDEDRAFT_28778 [Batrachochytrium dendrobatidis JAM81]